MRQYKTAVGVLAITSCFMTFLLYCWNRRASQAESLNHIKAFLGSESEKPPQFIEEILEPDQINQESAPIRHMRFNDINYFRDEHNEPIKKEANVELILDTPGCQIPMPLKPLYPLQKGKRKKPGTCGNRAVFFKKVDGDTVRAIIKQKIVTRYLRKSAMFECCYRFIHKSNRTRQELKRIRYASCIKFMGGDIITLETDFINVKCAEKRNNISREVYDDVFAFTKKFNTIERETSPCKRKYNVLLLGMDSMSMLHFEEVMTKTTQFISENSWLAFRAYNKIGVNTIPNLMAAFTGMNMSSIKDKCADRMDKCQSHFIWNKFRELGYVTAYGEDFLRLPDTFHGNFEFKKPPTDHYLRPLFIKGETELFNATLVCAGKIPSGQHLLDYALDFALTYKSESFFGWFWMNSYSHNVNNRPEDADQMIEKFLIRLTNTGALENTFVIFFSDHGIRFGEPRMHIPFYYDERLPMLYAWTPALFKIQQPQLFNHMVENQFKLVTPYDLYNTLIDIHRISSCDRTNETVVTSAAEGCANCKSLFNAISENRTCVDASIHQKWCTCHKLSPLNMEDSEASLSVDLVVSQVQNLTRSVQPRHCWRCRNLSLQNIVRIHYYFEHNKLYHVVALSMGPGNVTYEATVLRNIDKAELIGPVSAITLYRGFSNCAARNAENRKFCVCQKIENCA